MMRERERIIVYMSKHQAKRVDRRTSVKRIQAQQQTKIWKEFKEILGLRIQREKGRGREGVSCNMHT